MSATHGGSLNLVRRADGWWVVGLHDPACPEAGPYATKSEADETRRGLERTARYGHRRSFWTIT